MSKKENNVIELEGIVKERLPDTRFVVEVDIEGVKHEIEGHLSGKMRMNYIRILEGDTVTIEVTPYDPQKGRITYRKK